MKHTGRMLVLFAVLLALVLVPFFLFGEDIETWVEATVRETPGGRRWTAAVLGGSLAADIFLPVPSSLASTACGNLLGLGWGALTSWVGMMLSCLAGYWLGLKGGLPAAERVLGREDVARLQRWNRRFGNWLIIVARPVPVLAEASIVVVGVGRMDWRRFVLLCALANAGISLAYAAVGAYAADVNAFMLAFAFSIVLPGIAMLIARRLP